MYTAIVMTAYGTGAGYGGSPAHRYTTVRGVAMCRSPKSAIREAIKAAVSQPVALLEDGVWVGEDWLWVPVLETVTLFKDGTLLGELF